MKIADIQEMTIDVAKHTKEALVAEEGGPTDLHPQIVCFRGDEMVAMVLLQDHVRDEILRTFWYCAMGFAADSIATFFETYMASYGPGDDREAAKQGLNPRTGKPWGEGGMQREAELFSGVEKGLVTEAIGITTVNRAGDAAFSTLPFHYDGNTLVWEEARASLSTVDGAGENVVTGHMLRQMVKAMNMPAIEAIQRELALRTTIHERDAWTAKFLMSNIEGQVVLASSDDPERMATLEGLGEELRFDHD